MKMIKERRGKFKELMENFVDELEELFDSEIEGIEIKLEHPNREDDTSYASIKEVNIYYLHKTNIWSEIENDGI